jgi:hypothetical protein
MEPLHGVTLAVNKMHAAVNPSFRHLPQGVGDNHEHAGAGHSLKEQRVSSKEVIKSEREKQAKRS